MEDTLLTVEELALLLKVPRSWIYQHIRRGGQDPLPHIKLGKYLRFEEKAVRAWLNRHQQGNPVSWSSKR
jgi:excisionase family DNA binding protein